MKYLTKFARGLRRWELALMAGVLFAVLAGAWLSSQQAGLADQVVRLHVVAHSDSPEDQALKLMVRDHVLETVAPMLSGATVEEARAVIEAALSEIEQAAGETVAEAGASYTVAASLEQVWFPTKEYTDFALPAGNYTALRVVIGEGTGQNWWCVVFPPLCLGSVTETVEEAALAGGLTEDQVALMTGETEGYVVKFKAIEWWETLKNHFQW